MKTRCLTITLILCAMLLVSCNVLTNAGTRVITPSNVIISENRDASDFHAIEFTTLGKVNIMQGDKESLNISGPDNLVPEISTTVSNGTLIIKNKGNITINPLGNNNPLVFTIVVKDLTSLDISGMGDVQIEAITTPSLDINMSGAGKVQQNQITTDDLNIDLSGAGGIEVSGQSTQATIDISGAGSLDAPDLQITNAKVSLSGLGSATLWVTGQLDGDISGVGNVSYYGSPQTNMSTSGIGQFKALGNK